jgi:hypothetical protein
VIRTIFLSQARSKIQAIARAFNPKVRESAESEAAWLSDIGVKAIANDKSLKSGRMLIAQYTKPT